MNWSHYTRYLKVLYLFIVQLCWTLYVRKRPSRAPASASQGTWQTRPVANTPSIQGTISILFCHFSQIFDARPTSILFCHFSKLQIYHAKTISILFCHFYLDEDLDIRPVLKSRNPVQLCRLIHYFNTSCFYEILHFVFIPHYIRI